MSVALPLLFRKMENWCPIAMVVGPSSVVWKLRFLSGEGQATLPFPEQISTQEPNQAPPQGWTIA